VRFLADECRPAPIVSALRAAGHDVLHALESYAGLSDRNLAELAERDDWIVITEDYGFGELAVRGQLSLPGLIILFRNEAASEVRAGRVPGDLEWSRRGAGRPTDDHRRRADPPARVEAAVTAMRGALAYPEYPVDIYSYPLEAEAVREAALRTRSLARF
jgi:predicted nuclease of predicted toxin-antitoxin system